MVDISGSAAEATLGVELHKAAVFARCMCMQRKPSCWRSNLDVFRLHLQRLLHSVRRCSPYGAGPCGHRWLLCRTWRMSGCSCIRSGRCLCSKANSMYAAELSLSEACMVSFVRSNSVC